MEKIFGKAIVFFVVASMVLSGCTSPVEKEKISSLKALCEAEGKIFFYEEGTRQARCDPMAKDAGKRCTKTTDCEGYCAGSNSSTSSGTCSKELQPQGCVAIIERGERFERCFSQ